MNYRSICRRLYNRNLFRDSRSESESLWLHTDAIEVRNGVRSGAVDQASGASPSSDVALNDREVARVEVGAALQKIGSRVDALPNYEQTTPSGIGWALHEQEGGGVGRIQAGHPLLPVIHAVAVGVLVVG